MLRIQNADGEFNPDLASILEKIVQNETRRCEWGISDDADGFVTFCGSIIVRILQRLIAPKGVSIVPNIHGIPAISIHQVCLSYDQCSS